jgi:hypothetical protein
VAFGKCPFAKYSRIGLDAAGLTRGNENRFVRSC